MQGPSPELANNKGLNAGDYFLSVRETILGPEVIICVVGRRAHALLIENQKKSKESFDYKSPIFQEIMNTPNAKDQSIRSSWAAGDFLVFLPEQDEMCSYFPGARTARYIALDIMDHMKEDTNKEFRTNCFTLKSEIRSFGPTNRCQVPLVEPLETDKQYFPSDDQLKSASEIFYRPVKDEMSVEVVDTSEVER